MAVGLHLAPAMGMAGDMFAAALIGAGAPAGKVTQAMTLAASKLGKAQVTANRADDEHRKVHLEVRLESKERHLAARAARKWLDMLLDQLGIAPRYAQFARTVLEILAEAELQAHHRGTFLDSQTPALHLSPIGVVHSPYVEAAPAQPSAIADAPSEGAFWIELVEELAPALAELEQFRHVWLISYLHRVQGFDLFVKPPWDQSHVDGFGLFATRTPHRPNPIGLTKASVLGVRDNILYTGPLDLYDGTPLLDIKPYVQRVDEYDDKEWEKAKPDAKEDGWVDPTDRHLEWHRRNIPHDHGSEPTLHEAMDILLDVMGAAVALQSLDVDLSDVTCEAPVRVGGGTVRFSHGMLQVPAPATRIILERYGIPFKSGPEQLELLTPTGAAILAALRPKFVERCDDSWLTVATGWGQGSHRTRRPNEFRVSLVKRSGTAHGKMSSNYSST